VNRAANSLRMTVSDPLLTLKLRNQLTRGNLLANPRIRVRNKEKAKIHIGDKVPVFTATTTATGFVADTVNYLDVGIKLEVEPVIYLENEVAIKVALEVSSLGLEVRSPSGTLANRIGTRNASTTLRLKNGETQILAGLISTEDRRIADRVPGLGELPVIGRLFSSNDDRSEKTEIILLITPRIVRNLVRLDSRFEEFPGGTEAGVGTASMGLPSAPPGAGDAIVVPRAIPGAVPVPPAPKSAAPASPVPAPAIFPPAGSDPPAPRSAVPRSAQ
jgi:general secretion pathway protein D